VEPFVEQDPPEAGKPVRPAPGPPSPDLGRGQGGEVGSVLDHLGFGGEEVVGVLARREGDVAEGDGLVRGR